MTPIKLCTALFALGTCMYGPGHTVSVRALDNPMNMTPAWGRSGQCPTFRNCPDAEIAWEPWYPCMPEGCEMLFDADHDGDVDLYDYYLLQTACS